MRRREEDPDQLLLPFVQACGGDGDGAGDAGGAFPPVAGATWQLSMRVDYPRSVDPDLVQRLDRAGRRLARGAVASNQKLRKLAGGLEAIAGLFDG